MKNIKPDFYSEFSCIADKCTDSCCIGWEIDIDEITTEKYKQLNGDFGEKLRKCISFEAPPHFKLCENDRCPLLNKDGLCDLIINCQEEYLCDICREHPRFYEWYGNYRDCGLGLCCEEACRLLFSSDKPLSFTEEMDEICDDNTIDLNTAEEIFSLRKRLFEIISDREKKSLVQRIKMCCKLLLELQGICESECNCDVKEISQELIEISKEAEPFDGEWTKFTDSFSFDKLNKSNDKTEADYERLFTYFVFRHFIKAVYDNDLVLHFKVCLLLFAIQLLFDRSNAELNKIEAVKYISKQFEYSDENISLLEFECDCNIKLSFKNIVECIEYLL